MGLSLAIAGAPLLAIAQEYRPPRRGIPTRREGAGTRGPSDRCMAGPLPFMSLTPSDNFSLTTSTTPAFFWYVPTTDAAMAEFRVLDRTDREIYATSVNLTGVPGVVSLQVPPQVATQLNPGVDYIWQFSLQCSLTDPSKNPFMEGIFQRIAPAAELTSALEAAKTPREIASVYANAGIWHEAIATLAVQRCTRPTDSSLSASWQTLLRSVNLDRLSDAPLTQSCQAMGRQ